MAFTEAKVYLRQASTRAAPPRYAEMETRLTLRPGQNGTRTPDDMIYVRIGYGKEGLHAKQNAVGAPWRPQVK